ncbi:cytochrome P450 family protein [Ceratobasidium sp. AG-Ba]|nr:cytochrome P450 family protein [Ceratobasidium sp. AG-Ba]
MQTPWNKVLAPGVVPPVELLPFLKYTPKYFAPWKTYCEKARELQRRLFFGLVHETKEQVAQGRGNGCFIEQVLARQNELNMSDEQLGYLGGALIEGGGGTSASWIKSLILAMVTCPDAQRKAQEELDMVVGKDRMPVYEDLPNLPYIQAVIKEVHRWRPTAPLAVPHATIEEVNYAGSRIPPGTTIFINTWGMCRDPDVYERPENFWPDRWVQQEFGAKISVNHLEMNPPWFGSGRRGCPGVYLANNTIALNTTHLLWAFDFAPEDNPKTGRPIEIDLFAFAEGPELCPDAFPCTITPRSAQHAEIIKQEFASARTFLQQYEHGLGLEGEECVDSRRI